MQGQCLEEIYFFKDAGLHAAPYLEIFINLFEYVGGSSVLLECKTFLVKGTVSVFYIASYCNTDIKSAIHLFALMLFLAWK